MTFAEYWEGQVFAYLATALTLLAVLAILKRAGVDMRDLIK